MELVRSYNVPFALKYGLTWPQGNAFVLAIEPILCCRLILNTRLSLQTGPAVTGLTSTSVAALETELETYRDCRRPARKQLDSMGFPKVAGASISNSVYSSIALIDA